MMATTDIVRADTPQQWAVARQLVREYATSLGVDLGFQGFEDELRHLENEYGPPGGRFLLAGHGGEIVGCGAIRRFSESACEMKRLYVAPRGQRRGIGRLLAVALIDEARALGYRTVLLDTLPSMHAAHELYRSLGFSPVPSYRFNPVPGASFLKLDL